MDKAASIFLRADINCGDLDNLIHWLECDSVTRYLSDDFASLDRLRELSEHVPEHLLTMNLNQDGLFYIIDALYDDETESPAPVGFVRLAEYALRRYELVFAIGVEELWGRGFGTAAVRQALSIAFFELRAECIRARVLRGNRRSEHVMANCGLLPGYNGDRLMEYTVTFRQYLSHLDKLHAC